MQNHIGLTGIVAGISVEAAEWNIPLLGLSPQSFRLSELEHLHFPDAIAVVAGSKNPLHIRRN